MSSIQSAKPKVISIGGKVVGIQVNAELMVRMYMQTTTPQRFGVRIVREIPEILKNKEAREALNIPAFDSVMIREAKHSPLEADLTLIYKGDIVGRYSVKASPTGNIDYIVNSWRHERKAYDLIAVIPLEGRKNGESLFFVAIILVPKFLKSETPSRIKRYIYDIIEAKRIEEGLDTLWLTDFTEISSTLQYLSIARKQDEIIKKQDELLKKLEELLKKQGELLKKQDELLKEQGEMLKNQNEMIIVLREILKVLKELRDKM